MKTRVSIQMQGWSQDYKFNASKSEFLREFNKQVNQFGHYSGDTITGETVFITPNHCSYIEITEVTKE